MVLVYYIVHYMMMRAEREREREGIINTYVLISLISELPLGEEEAIAQP